MSSLSKFQLRLMTYSKNLRSVVSESTYFVSFHFLYITLIEDVFRLIMAKHSIERKDEFLLDFKLFVNQMKRKYASDRDYGYELRSHSQFMKSLDYDQTLDEKPRIERFSLEDDDFTFR